MADDRYNIYRSTVHWRYAMARPNLMFFDARLIFFVILFAFHIRWWTFAVLVFAIAGLSCASYFNYSVEDLIRLVRSKIVGSFRPAVPYTRLRPMGRMRSDRGQEASMMERGNCKSRPSKPFRNGTFNRS